KVGDWIVVGEHQGYVRRISVRATEIETFDRASLILPNSELISGAVQNWTHRNAMGRIVVNVGVTYSADPAEVMKILKSAADSCGVLLQFPQPLIVFENFGDSALEFSVRGYVGDVNTSLSSKTKLRVAIAEGLKANGIEIPFPQQDIHLRDLDGFKTMVARATGPKVDPSGGEQTGPQPAASPSKVRDREPAPAAGAVAAPASDASAKPQPTTTPEPPRVAFPDLPRRRA
ncbi:MAG: mechanosensitive ion channel domain-containing protein, partial [Pseudomonadota bacterium]